MQGNDLERITSGTPFPAPWAFEKVAKNISLNDCCVFLSAHFIATHPALRCYFIIAVTFAAFNRSIAVTYHFKTGLDTS
jgi:hypothetical protein